MWIDKQELKHEIKQFQLEYRASERLGEMLLQLARGVASRYARDLDADEAVAAGVCHLLMVIRKYDPSKSDPFSYLTTILVNHFRQMRRDAKYRSVLLAHVRFEMGAEDHRPKIPEYKNCIGCDQTKHHSQFSKNLAHGLAHKCKNCNGR